MGKRPTLAERQAATTAALAAVNPLSGAANGVRDDEPATPPSDMLYLRHGQIIPDPNNPRTDFDDEALAELAESIATYGLMQNLVVIAERDWTGLRHQLIAGERRWRAIDKLFQDGRWDPDRLIPCRAMAGLDAETRAVQALMENLVRRDLKPLEEARAFKALRDTFGQKTDAIATRVNRTQRFVQQRLQLLELDARDQARLDNGEINVEDARRKLANRAPAFVFQDEADRIAACEIQHALAVAPEPINEWERRRIEVGSGGAEYGARFNDRFEVWRAHADARLYLRLAYSAGDRLRECAPLEPGPEGYRTCWLNGPFEPDAELLAKLAQRAAEDEASRAESAQRREAEATKYAEAQKAHDQLLQRARDPSADVAEILATLCHPLPWRWQDETEDTEEGVYDADDQLVELWSPGAILPFLIARAVNALAGVADPIPQPEELSECA